MITIFGVIINAIFFSASVRSIYTRIDLARGNSIISLTMSASCGVERNSKSAGSESRFITPRRSNDGRICTILRKFILKFLFLNFRCLLLGGISNFLECGRKLNETVYRGVEKKAHVILRRVSRLFSRKICVGCHWKFSRLSNLRRWYSIVSQNQVQDKFDDQKS